MNACKYRIAMLVIGYFVAGYAVAGQLGADQITVDANILQRDSGNNTVYLYNNNGTVNNSADDIALAGTDRFSTGADTGYRIAGSKRLTGKWSLNAGVLSSELSEQAAYTDPNRHLEIFRLPLTNNFDSADSVSAAYQSKIENLEINAVYSYGDNLDLFAGIAQVRLDEHFRITSNDSAAAGVGIYNINTENKMVGPQVGLAYSYRPSQRYAIYLIGKVAWLNNEASQNQIVDDSPSFTRSNSASDSHSSAMYELKLGVNYYFTRNFAMNIDYQYLNIADVALAEGQFDTTASGSNTLHAEDSLSWSGFSLGVGYYF